MTASNAFYQRAYKERKRLGIRSTYPNCLSLAERFWSKVEKSDGCWLWVGKGDGHGYGGIFQDGRLNKAHRVSWFLHYGAVPEGMHVLHTCDNPPCVNPVHLWLGTHADNMADMARKGRHFSRTKPHLIVRGERSGHARLTREAVADCRRRHAEGVPYPALAAQYGVRTETVARAVRGETWA